MGNRADVVLNSGTATPPAGDAARRALQVIERLQAEIAGLKARDHEPIAIIGMSCRLPQARDIEAFWELLRNGVDAIRETPAARWNADAWYDPQPGAPGKLITRFGGFIDDPDLFDPQFFGISPREAARMDPQQRLLLEVSWEALERAGLNVDTLAGSKTGVFIGISNVDYLQLQIDERTRIDAYAGTGNAISIAANRLSYVYDLRGPSISLDTACSSSLVSTHLAMQSLRRGESDLALAGGVNLILSPEPSIVFSHAHMLAPDGRCKTFDARADGYVRGEGCGVVVLKRLSDAQHDGDPILAVILGAAVNQDGKSNGLTAPNGLAQQAVIRAALADARLAPEQVSYIETHGTGTILGDPIEAGALGEVMIGRAPGDKCLIGSVKTNIGHLEAAAGVAGLIKVVLQLQHGEIAPHLHFEQPSPYIPFGELPLEVAATGRPWVVSDGQPRRAGLSSFGFGGVNAHLVLGEAPAQKMVLNAEDRDRHILALSAASEPALRDLAGRYAERLAAPHAAPLADLAHSAATGRKHLGVRLALTAATGEAAREQLAAIAAGGPLPGSGTHLGMRLVNGAAKIAFLFTGQGSQYAGMGVRLYRTHAPFRAALDRCDAVLRDVLPRPLLSVIDSAPDDAHLIDETTYTQPALFALEYALAELWRSWGVAPDYVLGHSVGEYAAACFAGVMRLEDGLRLITERARLMGSLPHGDAPDAGAMAAVFTTPERVATALQPYTKSVSIAAINGPRNVVISGRRAGVAALVAAFEAEGVTVRPLTVSHAFHSPLMDPILEPWERAAAAVRYNAPAIPVISNLTGEPVEQYDAAYWRRHVREAVQFDRGMHALATRGCQVFIEIGPAPTLTGMGKRCLGGDAGVARLWLPSLKVDTNDWEALFESLGEFYMTGGNVNWAGVDAPYRRNRVLLPTYPFQRERYWSESAQAAARRQGVAEKVGAAARESEAEHAETQEAGPEHASAGAPDPTVAPLTRERIEAAPAEERVGLIVDGLRGQLARVLALDPARINPESQLNHLGLDSIMAIELKSGVETALNVTLPIAALLQGPSITELATLLADLVSGAQTASDLPSLHPMAGLETGAFPLSVGQRAMWLQHQMAPGSVYNPVYAARIRAALDVDRLASAFQTLVARHPALRTTFDTRDGLPIQQVHAHLPAEFRIIDAQGLSETALAQRLGDEAYVPFDLTTGPLLRVLVFACGPADHVLLLSAHHIVTDLWSLATLVSQLGVLYGEAEDGAPPKVAPPLVRYTDFVDWQARLLAEPAGERMLAYWRETLSGELPELDLPTDRPRPAVQTYAGSVESLALGPELSRAIRTLSEEVGVTPFIVLLAAFQTLLHRYTGQDDLIVGTPTTGRSRPELADVIGYFVSPVAIRTNFARRPRVRDLLATVRETVAEALSNADYPFPLLVEKLRPHRDPSRTPIFQVMFALQRSHLLYEEGLSQFATGASGSALRLGGLPLESVAIRRRMSPFDLTMLLADGAEFSAAIEYNADLFDATTVRRMLTHYRTLLTHSVADPAMPVDRLPILTAEEAELIHAWRMTALKPLAHATIHEAFAAQVAATPDAVALYFEAGGGKPPVTLTYTELDDRAAAVAARLRCIGAGPDRIVALCFDRSPAMIEAILGVLKAGAAYLPLDPAIPSERLAAILADAQPLALLTTAETAAELPLDGAAPPVIKIDAPAEDPPNATDSPLLSVGADNLAYVIYTSGSTGAPKGVMLRHGGLVNLVEAQIAAFDVTPRDRVFQFAAYTFDASVSEIFIALTSGAALHLGRREVVLSPDNLARALREERITNITLPPTLLRLLDPAALPQLRTIISAGEACTADLMARWAPGRRFVNAYGPTETTIGPTYELVNDGSAAFTPSVEVAIGRPIPNVTAYVLDRHLQPTPIGIPGELCIGGSAPARGYLRGPAQTAEKFIPHGGGGRLYRTGDLVRWLPDGRIEFVGRKDHQMKIRGFRVEPGEIEAVLSRHPRIKEAVVVARDFGARDFGARDFGARSVGDGAAASAADQRLVAYLVADRGSPIDEGELRTLVKAHLPEYMTPAAFMVLDTLPLNSSGKVDRKALPSPTTFQSVGAADFAPPSSQLERELASIWQSVLGIERVGIHDNFFDLGGHSLLMAQAHNKVQALIGREMPIVDLFRFPTISLLAKHLSDDGASGNLAMQQGKERGQQQREALAKQRERMKALQQKRK